MQHQTPDLSHVRGMIVDMDGVLWRGDDYLPGMRSFFELLRARSIPFVLATNNATKTPEMTQAKLANAGVEVLRDEILSSAQAAAAHLRERMPHEGPVYAIGEIGLLAALTLEGFELMQKGEGSRAVVVGLDRSLTWLKLTEASNAILRGALFIGTNADPALPLEDGIGVGTGALLAALQTTTGIDPIVVGKPERYLFEHALSLLQTAPEETLVLGDRLMTDIQGGLRLGLGTGLLLTGVTRREDLANTAFQPDWIFENLTELCRALNA